MATEIAIFKIKEGDLPNDLSTSAGKIFQECIKTVLEQPGAQRAYWGIEVENPTNARLFIDWESIDAHKKFMNTDIYKPFGEKLGEMTDLSQAQMFHAHLKPDTQVLDKSHSPATEILLLYFPTDYSQADQDKFAADCRKLLNVVKDNSDKYTGDAGGWVVEELTIPDTEEKAKVFSAQIGWKSVQDHLDFRHTEAFKENIHLLRGAKDLKKLAVVHYYGNEVSK